jgi:hypothetical protein
MLADRAEEARKQLENGAASSSAQPSDGTAPAQ